MLNRTPIQAARNFLVAKPQPTTADIRAGQIWRDGHPDRNRLLLVLEVGESKVVCQNLQNRNIRPIRREQFNRGQTGLFLTANFYDMIVMFSSYAKDRINQQPSMPLD
jgi:hypothetical protein